MEAKWGEWGVRGETEPSPRCVFLVDNSKKKIVFLFFFNSFFGGGGSMRFIKAANFSIGLFIAAPLT